MFGKTVPEYLRFQRWVLIATMVVGLLRLVLSMAGAPLPLVKAFSMTGLALVGLAYYAVAIVRTGFGSYRHLFPLLLFQAILTNAITVAAIGFAGVTGRPNVFTAPEYSNLPNFWPHALGHLAAMVVVPIVLWPVGALLMWITKRVGGRDAGAGARA